ncbi:MAG: hypothetical protein CVU44_06245 [Chloroflexi bacterium HGW-Chloroflexi-6]|nr:MAG: hypothetical protein CVU44_06245 [Chloroflexi bacterium HGW-Chloroflexi-6]
MNKQAGLWIDHRKAVIVSITKEGEDIQKIESGVGKRVSFRGTSNTRSPFSSQYQQGDDQLDNKFTEQLNKFYSEVITHIRSADAVLIFGPGEAKGELEKRIEHEGLSARILAIETVDKMTDRQIVAKVRERFLI